MAYAHQQRAHPRLHVLASGSSLLLFPVNSVKSMSAAKLPNLLKASACQLSGAKRKVRGIIYYFSGSTLTRRSVYIRGLEALYFGASVKRPTAVYAAVPAQHDFLVYMLGGIEPSAGGQ